MANVLSEEKRERLGWSLRRIEQSTGVRRETASGYQRFAGVSVRARGRPPKPANSGITDSASENSKPASEGITDLSRRERKAVKDSSRSLCAPFREFICERMHLGRNSMAIYQDLVDAHRFSGRYVTVRRFVRALEGEEGPEAFVVIETAPGEEGQVDYGEGPMVRHPETGKPCSPPPRPQSITWKVTANLTARITVDSVSRAVTLAVTLPVRSDRQTSDFAAQFRLASAPLEALSATPSRPLIPPSLRLRKGSAAEMGKSIQKTEQGRAQILKSKLK